MRLKMMCGARTRSGTACKCKALVTKRGKLRCRLHGGLSSGPKTPEGRARISAAMRARWASVGTQGSRRPRGERINQIHRED